MLVGVDVAGYEGSYVNLAPDLWAGTDKHNHTFSLADELAAIDWTGRNVLIATPSNVTTNQKMVWDEYRLAVGLRDQVLMAFALDGQAFQIAEIFEPKFACPPRQIDCKLLARFMVVFQGKFPIRGGKPAIAKRRCLQQYLMGDQAACDSDL